MFDSTQPPDDLIFDFTQWLPANYDPNADDLDHDDAPQSNLEVALRLAKAGMTILPCGVDKIPRTKWRETSTRSESIIAGWWKRWPDALPAIDCGKSGLIVIDADRHGGPDGVAAFDALTDQNGGLRGGVPAIRTPNDGIHFYFHQPEGEPLGNRTGSIPLGIDVRGAGGLVVAPGAMLPDGRAWNSADGTPDLCEAYAAGTIPSLPAWLVDLIRTEAEHEDAPEPEARQEAPWAGVATDDARGRAYALATLEGVAAALAGQGEGGRNNALNSAAMRLGSMAARGWLTKQAAWSALSDACRQNGLWKGDGPAQCRKTFESGFGAGLRSPAADLPDDGRMDGADLSALGDEIAAMILGEDGVMFDPETGEIINVASRANEEGGEQGAGGAAQGEQKAKASARPRIVATPYGWPDPSEIPPRDWLYGRHLIRGFISATVAGSGIGKSSLVTTEIASLISGRPLLHGVAPIKPLNVWLWNGEDPMHELQRRLAATMKNYQIRRDACEGRLFVDSGRNTKIVIAETRRGDVIIARPIINEIMQTIRENEIDVVVIDPFVKSHRVSENDNTAIDTIASEWADIAERTGVAIELVHHVRKTGDVEVTVEMARGASALISSVRSARALNRMTKEEANNAGVEHRWMYFRVDDGKASMAPNYEQATWYRQQSVDLENRGPFQEGDSVGVAIEWEWPSPLDGVTAGDLQAVLIAVAAGRWRKDSQAKEWVGKAVANVLKLDLENERDKSKIKGLIKIWIKNGALAEVDGKDDQGKVRAFIEVGRRDDQ